MKISRIRRQSKTNVALPFEVTGPDYEHAFPSEGAAIARALDRTLDTGATHYIRELGDIIAHTIGESGKHARLVTRQEGAPA